MAERAPPSRPGSRFHSQQPSRLGFPGEEPDVAYAQDLADAELSVAAGGTAAVDDGSPGIPPERATSLFGRFDSGTSSNGLGVSIAWVAYAHGGLLTVAQSIGCGAYLVLRRPVAKRSEVSDVPGNL